jgi:alpha-beta hydrolase superfamily lysophospholipase
MRHSETSFEGAGGVPLFARSWLPETSPVAILLVIHGMGEHSGRYEGLAGGLVPAGYGIESFDLRGHGRSAGQRGHIDAWTDYLEDVDRLFGELRARHDPVPLFVLGHSLGALIACDFALGRPEGLHGIIASGTPIEPVGVAKPGLVLLARLLSSLWPRYRVRLRLDSALMSRDPAEVAKREEDPLMHGIASVRWGTEALAAVARVKRRAGEITLPVLLIHGGEDPVNAPRGTRWLFDQIAGSDKEIRIYAGAFHEAYNDIDSDRVLADLRDWLDRHRSAA